MSENNALSKILFSPLGVTYLKNGNILITDGGGWDGGGWGKVRSKVIEVNRLGEVVWFFDQGLIFAHNSRRLENGNTIIADTGNDRVLEVTPESEIVWDTSNFDEGSGRLGDGSTLNYPNDVHLLYNGRILISDRNNDRILEINRSGEICWQYERCLHQHGVQRLANGNTLFADSEKNRVVEVDLKGNPVWNYGDDNLLRWPRDANRLKNGNTLIADSRNHRIIEVNKKGEKVWSYDHPLVSSPYEVDADSEERVIFSDSDGRQVMEVDRSGNILWCFRNFYRREPLPRVLLNGDFHKVSPDNEKVPQGWSPCLTYSERSGSSELIHDKEKGKEILKLKLAHRGFLWLHQGISIVAGQPYEIGARVKVREVEGYAQIQAVFLDANGRHIHGGNSADFPGGMRFTGTCDWTMDKAVIWPPPGATAVNIRCFLANAGEAWFDDVAFEPVQKLMP